MQQKLHLAACWFTLLIPLACTVSRAAADVGLSATAILFLVHAITTQRTDWLRTRWVQVALLLWVYLLLIGLGAENIEKSIGRAAAWLRFPIFTVALSFWVLTESIWRKRLIQSLCIAVGFMLFDTALQYAIGIELLGREPIPAEGSPRLTGPFSSPRVGIMLVWMAIPAIAYGLMRRDGALQQGKTLIMGALYAVGLMTVIFTTGERMALLLTGLSFAIAFFLLPIPKKIMLGLGATAALLMVALAALNPGLIERQVGSTSQVVEGFSGSDYGQIWHSAFSMVQQHPITGVGLRQFRELCPQEAYGPLDTVESRCNLHPHNIYLEWLVESGIIGLSLFIALMVMIICTTLRPFRALRCHPVYLGLLITFAIRLWPLASSTSFFTAWSAVPFWLVVGWVLAIAMHSPKENSQ